MANIAFNPNQIEQGKAVISMALGLITGQKDVDIVALTENDSDDPDFEKIFPLNMPLGDDADDDDKALYAIAQALETHADQLAETLHFELIEASEGQSVVDFLRDLLACCSDRHESSEPLTRVSADLSKIDIEDGGAERCYKLNKKRFKGTRQILIQVFGVDEGDVEEKPDTDEEEVEKKTEDKGLDVEEMFGAGNNNFDDGDGDGDDFDDGDGYGDGDDGGGGGDRSENRTSTVSPSSPDSITESVAKEQVLANRWVEKCYEELKRPKSLLRLAKIGLTQPRAGEAFSDMIHELRTGQGIGNPHHPVPLIPKSVQTKSGNQLYTMALRTVGRRLANEMEQMASEAGVQLTR